MKKTLWMKFHATDWLGDANLRMVSMAANGLWMHMLCLMFQSESPGKLKINSRNIGVEELARVLGRGRREIEISLQELEENGIFSRDDSGCIYSRRMLQDLEKYEVASQHGKRGGGNPRLKPLNPSNKGGLKGTYKGGLKGTYKGGLKGTYKLDTDTDTDIPLPSPRGQADADFSEPDPGSASPQTSAAQDSSKSNRITSSLNSHEKKARRLQQVNRQPEQAGSAGTSDEQKEAIRAATNAICDIVGRSKNRRKMSYEAESEIGRVSPIPSATRP